MGKIVKKDQGQTLFASQLASYEALDKNTKDKIENLIGIFSSAGPISVTRLEREAEREVLENQRILLLNIILLRRLGIEKHYI